MLNIVISQSCTIVRANTAIAAPLDGTQVVNRNLLIYRMARPWDNLVFKLV